MDNQSGQHLNWWPVPYWRPKEGRWVVSRHLTCPNAYLPAGAIRCAVRPTLKPVCAPPLSWIPPWLPILCAQTTSPSSLIIWRSYVCVSLMSPSACSLVCFQAMDRAPIKDTQGDWGALVCHMLDCLNIVRVNSTCPDMKERLQSVVNQWRSKRLRNCISSQNSLGSHPF